MDIRTVVQLANESIATVSCTINRVSTVNPKMAKRVWEAIEKPDYFPIPRRERWFRAAAGCWTDRFRNHQSLLPGADSRALRHRRGARRRDSYQLNELRSPAHVRAYDACWSAERRGWERRRSEWKTAAGAVGRAQVPLVFVDEVPERPGISLLRVDYRHGIRQGVQHLAVPDIGTPRL